MAPLDVRRSPGKERVPDRKTVVSSRRPRGALGSPPVMWAPHPQREMDCGDCTRAFPSKAEGWVGCSEGELWH